MYKNLDGSGIESRCWREFSSPSRPCLGPTQPPLQYQVFPGLKRPGCGIDQPPPSSAEVKEKVDLYITPPLGLRGLSRENFTFYLHKNSVRTLHSFGYNMFLPEQAIVR